MKKILLSIFLLLSILPALAQESPKREMRGAWVATIYGLDWPKVKGTDAATAEAQKKEMIQMLDRLQGAGINAVMFQARTFSDAMYRSELEPWAVALTGKRGVSPAGNWDPLAFCIEESHRRGMECHAWINPFRYSTSATAYADKFDSALRPMLITHTIKPKNRREKAKSTVILDPGNPRAREHVVNVCRDIVSRYDVDGIIFDDYFYPDKLPLGSGYDFNEWKKSGTKLSQADWRRENVNATVEAVYRMIQEVKPYVRFGISPAGVGGGNGVSASRYDLPTCTGNDWMYDRIFCDPLAWMAQGHVDYISPQIYWARDHSTNPYGPIAEWWSTAAARFGCHFYGSISLSSLANKGGDTVDAWKERVGQIELNRTDAPFHAPGSILYAARNVNGLGRHLASTVWSSPAIPPAIDWKEAPELSPVGKIERKAATLSWKSVDPLARYTVYAIPEDVSTIDAISVTHGGIDGAYLLGMTYTPSYTIPENCRHGYRYAVAPLDRYGNEWEPSFLE